VRLERTLWYLNAAAYHPLHRDTGTPAKQGQWHTALLTEAV
jgi:hypothetical protein